jgi:hypothetical protein
MFGGLKKSASRLALVAAAGVLSTGAYAADLGGDCCADLEERVAELEATTARKGNRRMSLQVYGWVNKTIMHVDDGARRNTFLGIDNTNSATRFGFRGDAKVSPTIKAGYSILLDVTTGATSALVTATREEAPAGCTITGNPGNPATTAPNSLACGGSQWTNDHAIRMRDANVWLESSSVGRVTLGRLTVSGPQGTIDLGGIGNVASGSQSLAGGSYTFVGGGRTLAQVTDALADYNNRVDGLKWDSPTFAGFVVGASIGETLQNRQSAVATDGANGNGSIGRLWAVNARYAGEFSGVRLAAAVGYEVSQAEELSSAAGGLNRADSKNLGLSLSALHAPTGLFAQGHWLRFDRGNLNDAGSDRATNWLVQAGISQNWFGVGKTALYGEYSKVNNGNNAFADALASNSLFDSRYTMWGLGVTQDIDAAAMQLYAGYRNHQLGFTNGVKANDMGIFMAGARVNF